MSRLCRRNIFGRTFEAFGRIGKGIGLAMEERMFSGNLKQWVEFVAKLLLEFERLGWITINREALKRAVEEKAKRGSVSFDAQAC